MIRSILDPQPGQSSDKPSRVTKPRSGQQRIKDKQEMYARQRARLRAAWDYEGSSPKTPDEWLRAHNLNKENR